MMITSTHGYSGLRHALLGSVAEQLARRGDLPGADRAESSRAGEEGQPRVES